MRRRMCAPRQDAVHVIAGAEDAVGWPPRSGLGRMNSVVLCLTHTTAPAELCQATWHVDSYQPQAAEHGMLAFAAHQLHLLGHVTMHCIQHAARTQMQDLFLA